MSERNKNLRVEYIKMVKENGLLFKFVSAKMGISNSTVSNWMQGNFDMGKEKLDIIEKTINKYTN